MEVSSHGDEGGGAEGSAEGGKAIAEALKFNTALNKLDLRYNGNMRDEGKQELRDSLKGREGFELLV